MPKYTPERSPLTAESEPELVSETALAFSGSGLREARLLCPLGAVEPGELVRRLISMPMNVKGAQQASAHGLL